MTHFTLDQIRALWRAFVSIGTVGTTGSIVGNEETPFNQALDDEWRLLQITFRILNQLKRRPDLAEAVYLRLARIHRP